MARTCAVFGVLFLISCFGESTGPEFRRGRFALAPHFASPHAARLIDVARVRIQIVRPGTQTVVLDTVVTFPPGNDPLAVELEVPVEGTSETFSLSLAMVNAAGDTVFRSGPDPITATSNALTPAAAAPVLRYTGVGFDAVGVRFVNPPAAAFFGQTVPLVAEAFDAAGAAIPGTPVVFELVNPADSVRARIPDPDVGQLIAGAQRGAVPIRALLLTEQTAQHTVAIQPVPNAIQIQGGNSQTGPAGQALTQQLVARVLAADNLGVQGVVVAFAVTAGGGSLSALTDTTDANGDVAVSWTLGTGTGPQAVNATAAGVTGGTVSFAATATAGAARRVTFTQEPQSLVPGQLFNPAIRAVAQDTFGNLATAFTGAISLTILNNPGGGALTGTTTVNAVAGEAIFGGVGLTGFGSGYTLLASATGLASDTSVAFNVLIGPPAQLAFQTVPGGGTAGAPLTPAVQVLIQDAAGTTVPTATLPVTIALGVNPSNAALGGTLTANAVGGVATFSDLTLDRSGAGYTLTAASAGLTGATSPAFDISAGAAAALVLTSALPASIAAGAPLAVTVEMRDALGNVVTSFAGPVSLALGANPGGATLGGTLTVNAVAGVATFTDPFLDRTGTGYTLAATAAGVPPAVSGAFDVTPAAAQTLVFAAQPPGTQVAGQPLALLVEIRDGLGNVATSFAGPVTLALGANPGGATLGGTLTVNAVAGVATFADPFLDLVGAGYTLTASATGLTAGTSTAFAITPAAAAILAVTAHPAATQTAGAAFGLTVTARDAFGNVATGFTGPVTIALAVNPGGATLSGTLTLNALAGIATFSDAAVDLVGTGYAIAVTAPGLSGAQTGAFDVTAAAAAQLVFTTTPPPSQTAGVPVTIAVAARDALGNPVSGFTGSVTLGLGANPGGATLSGTLTVSAVAGVATFSDPFLDRVGAGYTLTAAAAGLTTATSGAFAITPAAAASLVISTQPPASQTAGAPLAIAVTALDAFGNVATGFSGAVALALGANPGGATLSGTLSVPASAGIATFNDPALDLVGSGYTLAASAAGITGAATNAFDITPAAAASLQFVAQPPANVTAGAPFPVTVRAMDGFGNTDASFAGAVTLALSTNPGGATLGGTVTVSAVAGVATFSDPTITVAAAGYGLSATATGIGAAGSTAFAVDPAAPAQLVFTTPPPASQQAGAPFAVAVAARDAFGNATPTYAGSVTLSLATNPGGATLGGTLTVVAAGGVASFADPFLDRTGTGYGLAAAAAGLTTATSGGFDITAAAATALAITTQPPATQTAGAPLALVVTALDPFGNVATGFTGTVTLALGANPGGATLSGTLSVAAVLGVATFSDPSLDLVASGYTLAASAAGVSGATSGAVDITPAAAATLQFSAQPPGTVTAGAAFTVAVRAVDAFGNLTPAFSGTVALALGANPGGATLGGTLSVAAVAGIATFNDPSLTVAAAGYSLTATAAGLTAGGSTSFAVDPAAPAQLVFSAPPPASQAAGAPVAVAVQARDAFGNPTPAFTGTVTLALAANPGPATLGGTLAVAAIAGVASFADPFLDVAATGYTFTATAAGLGAATSGSFDITAAAAQALVFSTPPGAAYQAGAPIAVTVTARDPFGNTATGFTQNVTLSLAANPGPGTLSGTITVAAVAGVASFATPFLDRAAAGYVLAADGGSLTTATSGSFDITPAPASQLVFTTQPPSSVSAQTDFAATITAQDPFGNTDPAFIGTVTVALGTNPTGAVLSGSLSLAAVAGVAAFTDLRLDNFGIGYTLTATAAPLSGGTSGLLDVTPAPAQVAWLNTAGGNWSVGANWSNGVGPAAGDTVLITQNGTYTVILDAPATVAKVIIGSSSGAQTLVLNGPALTIADGLAGGANATLDLQGGALLLTGPGAIGQVLWSGGDLSGVGQVLTAGTVAISGTAPRALTAIALEVTTGGTWTGTHAITHGGGAVLRLAAGGVMTSDATPSFVFSGTTPALTLEVRGTLTLNAGAVWPVTTNVGSGGTLAVATGTLDLGGGGLADGTITVAPGAALLVSGGTLFLTTLGQLNTQGDVTVSGGTLLTDGVVTSSASQVRITGGTLVWNNAGGAVDTLHLSAGQVGGSGTLAVQRHFDWTGGALMGSGGTLRVEAAATAAISGSAPRTLSDLRLDLAGTGTWAGQHDLTHGGGAVLRVLSGGQLDVSADPTFTFNGSSPGLVLDVAGTLNAAPATLLTLPVPVNVAGQLNVVSGTLQLNGGSSSTGALNLSPGTTAAINAGTVTFGGASSVSGNAAGLRVGGTGSAQFAGAVTVQSAEVQAGLLQFDGAADVALDSLRVSGGVLSGSSDLRVATFFRWLGGTVSGMSAATDTLDVLPGAALVIDTVGGTATHQLTHRVLLHRSAAGGAWTSGAVSSSNGGTLVNAAGAVLTMSSSANFASGTAPGIFTNLGTIVVNAGGPSAAGVGTALHNDGALSVPAGAFVATGGGTSVGSFTLGSTGALRLSGGHTLTAASTIQGQGEVEFAGGGQTVAGFYNLDGGTSVTRVTGGQVDFTFGGAPDTTDALVVSGGVVGGTATLVSRTAVTWSAGGFSGGGITRAIGTAQISGPAAKTVDGAMVQLLGATQHTQGAVALSNGGILRNAVGGTYTMAGGTSVDSVAGTGNLFENFGALHVTGTVTISAQFITASPVDVQAGDLVLANGGTLNGTVGTAAGSTMRLTAGQLILGASLAPAAGTHLEIAGGTASIASGTVIVDSLTLSGGTLSGAGAAGANAFVWSGGTLAGAGTTDAQLRLWLPNATGRVLDGRVLRNLAQGRFQGGSIEFRNAGRLENLGPADFYIQADGAFTQGPGAAGVFDSPGFIQMEAAASLFTTAVTFQQSNSLQLDAGRFRLEGSAALGSPVFFNTATATLEVAGQSAADTVVASGSFDPQGAPDAIRVSSGVLRLGPGLFITQIDSLDLAGGVLDNRDTVAISQLTWTGGTLAGQGGLTRIPSGGSAVIAGATLLGIDSTTLHIDGNALWTSAGGLAARNGATIQIAPGGLLEMQSDAGISDGGGIGQNRLVVHGTLLRSAGSVELPIAIFTEAHTGLSVNNAGLALTAGGLLGGTNALNPSTTLRLDGPWAVDQNATFSGLGTMVVAGNGLLDANARTLQVPRFETQGNGRLVMSQPADTVTVLGDALFNGANPAGSLSDGVLRVQGNFQQAGTANFQPTGGHRVELVGPNPQTVSFADPTGSHFRFLMVAKGGPTDTTVTLASAVLVTDTLDLRNSARILGAGHLTVGRRVHLAGDTATIQIRALELGGELAVDVTGQGFPRLTLDTLLVTGALQFIWASSPDFVIQDLHVGPTGALTFTNGTLQVTRVTVDGQLDVGTYSFLDASSGGTRVRNGGLARFTHFGITFNSGPTQIDAGGTLEGLEGNWTADAVTVDGALSFPNSGTGVSALLTSLTTQGTGTLAMAAPGAFLTVNGNVVMGGGSTTGLLTAGTLAISGSFAQVTTPTAFAADPGHTVVFSSGGSTINFADPGSSRFGNLRVDETATRLTSDAEVAGLLEVINGAALIDDAPGTHRLVVGDSLHVPAFNRVDSLLAIEFRGAVDRVGGGIRADTVIFSGSDQVMPSDSAIGGGTIDYTHVRITTADSARAAGFTALRGSLRITAGEFRPAPSQSYNVGDDPGDSLIVTGTGQIFMNDSEVQLNVAGPVLWNTATSGANRLLSGDLFVGTNFTQVQTGAADNFAPAPGFSTRFSGTQTQTIRFGSPGAAAARFGDLEVANGAAPVFLASDAWVMGDLHVTTTPASLSDTAGTDNRLTVHGAIVDVGNGQIAPGTVELRGTGALQIPWVMPTNLVIAPSGTRTLTDSLRVTGNLHVPQGVLDLGGFLLQAQGHVFIEGTGQLSIDNGSDTLIAFQDLDISTTTPTVSLAQGFIIVHGNFNQINSSAPDNFAASNDFKLVFAGTGAQTIAMQSAGPTASRLGEVRLVNTTQPVTILDHAWINATLFMTAGATLNGPTGRLTIEGFASVPAGATIAPRYLGMFAGFSPLSGTLAADTTEWLGAGRLVAAGPETSYGTVIINGGGNWTWAAPDTVTGNLVIRQGELFANNHLIHVGGSLRTELGGRIMTQFGSGDHFVILGNLELDGGTSQLQDDLVEVGGNITVSQPAALQAFSGNTLTFLGAGPHTITMQGGSSFFGDVQVPAGNDLTLVGDVRISGALTLNGGSTVTGDTLWVTGALATQPGDDIAPTLVVLETAPILAAGAGTLRPGTLGLGGASPPTVQALNLGSDVAVPDTLLILGLVASGTVNGSFPMDLTVDGAGAVLTVGGASNLQVRRFLTRNSGRLAMSDPSASLLADTARFHGGSTNGLLTAGQLVVFRRLEQAFGVGDAYSTLGSFLTHINPTSGLASIQITVPAASRLAGLRINGGFVTTLESDVVVDGLTTLNSFSVLSGGFRLVTDSLTVETSASINTNSVELTEVNQPLVLFAGASFQPDTVVLNGGDDVTLPAGAYRNVRVINSSSLDFAGSGAVVSTEFLSIESNGRLFVNDDQITVNGIFQTITGGSFQMSNAAGLLEVTLSASFAGGTSQLDAGLLRLAGPFSQTGSIDAFLALPAHITEFVGGVHDVAFNDPGPSRFGTLRLNGATAGIQLQTPVVASFLQDANAGFQERVRGTGGVQLTVDSVAAQNIVFDNAPLSILAQQPTAVIDGIRFENMSPTVTQLALQAPPGLALSLANVDFATVPTLGVGYYVSFAQVGTGPVASLTLNPVTPNAAAAAGLFELLGTASINWGGSIFPTPAPGINTWLNASGGLWSNPANWSRGFAPLAQDTVQIQVPGTYTVQLDQAATVGWLVLGGGAGTQTLDVQSNTLTVNDSVTVATTGALLLGGGVLSSAGPVFMAGAMTWNGGTLTGGGTTTILSGATLTISGAGTQTLDGGMLLNQGTVNFTGAGNLAAGNGATIRNEGLFDWHGDGQIVHNLAGATPAFENTGAAILRRNTSATTATLAIPLRQEATVSLLAGSLRLTAGSLTSFQGTVNGGAARTLELAGGTFTQTGTLTANARVDVQAGELSLGGFSLVASQSFATSGSGAVRMLVDTDSILATGSVTFAGGASTLDFGGIKVGGDFTQGGAANAFAPSAVHGTYVQLNGNPNQNITFADPGSSYFGVLNVQATNVRNIVLQTDVVVRDTIMMVGGAQPATLIGAGTTQRLVANGVVRTQIPAGTSPRLAPPVLVVNGGPVVIAATASPTLGLNPDTTVFTGAIATLPIGLGINYRSIRLNTGAVVTIGTDTIAGDLDVESGVASFSAAGTFRVAGTLRTRGTGALSMTNAGRTVEVGDSATFLGGSTAGLLTAGTLRLGGAFVQGGASAESFVAAPAHTTAIGGSGALTPVSMANPGSGAGASRFGTLLITRPGANAFVDLLTNVQAAWLRDTTIGADSLLSSAGAVVTADSAQLTSTVFDNTRLVLSSSGGTQDLSALRFQNMDPTTTHLTLARDPGLQVTITGIDFLTTPTLGQGFYVAFTQAGVGPVATLNLTSVTPAAALVSGLYTLGGTASITWGGVPNP